MAIDRMLLVAAGIGLIAGMRTFTAPVAARHRMVDERYGGGVGGSRPRAGEGALTALAILEMIMDKGTQARRIQAPALAARVASGALSARALAAQGGRPSFRYGALAGVAAVAGAYGFYLLRRDLGRRFGIPDGWLGVAEDLLAVLGAVRLSRI